MLRPDTDILLSTHSPAVVGTMAARDMLTMVSSVDILRKPESY
jgi:hypothetical protein